METVAAVVAAAVVVVAGCRCGRRRCRRRRCRRCRRSFAPSCGLLLTRSQPKTARDRSPNNVQTILKQFIYISNILLYF